MTSLEHHRKKFAAEAASTPETQISPVFGVQGFRASLWKPAQVAVHCCVPNKRFFCDDIISVTENERADDVLLSC